MSSSNGSSAGLVSIWPMAAAPDELFVAREQEIGALGAGTVLNAVDEVAEQQRFDREDLGLAGGVEVRVLVGA